ncbi:MAG: LPXTG cell wall anchor domain-containing protein [Clostridia bacterium]|nr:LPXTG cell wall anchor domain-containing protein [Clostridia bacterium]
MLEIPKTGDAPGAALAVVLMAGALILAAVIWRRTRKTN